MKDIKKLDKVAFEEGIQCNQCKYSKPKIELVKARFKIKDLENKLAISNKALDEACALAIQGNDGELSIAIHKGTREQYNLPLTLDSISNRKILKGYLLKESEDTK